MTIGEIFTRVIHGMVLGDARYVRPIPGTVCATENMGSFEVTMRPQNGENYRRVRVTVEVLRVKEGEHD